MNISVIIPTLNEERYIGTCIEHVRGEFSGEILVADGGSDDRTVEIARARGARVLSSRRGLAPQLNRAAVEASGDALFLVAADCLVPVGWYAAILKTLQSPYTAGGGFRLALEPSSFALRVIAFGGNLRSAHLRFALPDQGLFVRSQIFRDAGGFSEISYIPYATFCSRLGHWGEFRLLPLTMTASSRKWKEQGIVRTSIAHTMAFLKFRYCR